MIGLLLVKRMVASCKYEMAIVGGVISFVILLPLIGVLVITNAPVQAVSDAIASVTTDNKKVQLFEPNGQLIKEIEVSSTWPIHGQVTEEFGAPHYPFQDRHTGTDIGAAIGTPVTVFMEGKIIALKNDGDRGYGMHVIIDHGHNVTAIYGHLSNFRTEVGRQVKPGDIIGEVGSTGASTGPHLHIEIRVFGIPVNPRMFINGEPQ